MPYHVHARGLYWSSKINLDCISEVGAPITPALLCVEDFRYEMNNTFPSVHTEVYVHNNVYYARSPCACQVLASKGHDVMLHGFGTAETVKSAFQACQEVAPGGRGHTPLVTMTYCGSVTR